MAPPALTEVQLISLLEKDGWVRLGYRTHGVSMQKKDERWSNFGNSHTNQKKQSNCRKNVR